MRRLPRRLRCLGPLPQELMLSRLLLLCLLLLALLLCLLLFLFFLFFLLMLLVLPRLLLPLNGVFLGAEVCIPPGIAGEAHGPL